MTDSKIPHDTFKPHIINIEHQEEDNLNLHNKEWETGFCGLIEKDLARFLCQFFFVAGIITFGCVQVYDKFLPNEQRVSWMSTIASFGGIYMKGPTVSRQSVKIKKSLKWKLGTFLIDKDFVRFVTQFLISLEIVIFGFCMVARKDIDSDLKTPWMTLITTFGSYMTYQTKKNVSQVQVK